MNDFDYILSCLLIPVVYVLTYIAGKYDMLRIVAETLEAVAEKYSDKSVANVVRCQHCIHYEMGVCLKIYSDGAASEYAWQERKPNDFCSYGERRASDG